jgi:hypothetical protein
MPITPCSLIRDYTSLCMHREMLKARAPYFVLLLFEGSANKKQSISTIEMKTGQQYGPARL